MHKKFLLSILFALFLFNQLGWFFIPLNQNASNNTNEITFSQEYTAENSLVPSSKNNFKRTVTQTYHPPFNQEHNSEIKQLIKTVTLHSYTQNYFIKEKTFLTLQFGTDT